MSTFAAIVCCVTERDLVAHMGSVIHHGKGEFILQCKPSQRGITLGEAGEWHGIKSFFLTQMDSDLVDSSWGDMVFMPPPFGEYVYPGNVVIFSKLDGGGLCVDMILDMLRHLTETELETELETVLEKKIESKLIEEEEEDMETGTIDLKNGEVIEKEQKSFEEDSCSEQSSSEDSTDEEGDEQINQCDELAALQCAKNALLLGCGLYDTQTE